MKGEPQVLQPGDACPNCGGEIKPARVATAEEWRRYDDRDRRDRLPAGADTMRDEDRQEHGALHRCVACGYETRFPLETAGAAAGESPSKKRGK